MSFNEKEDRQYRFGQEFSALDMIGNNLNVLSITDFSVLNRYR